MEVSPATLEFKGPFTKASTEKLVLTNTSNEAMAYKVRTTAPKLYCVRPNASIVQPGQSMEVSIILLGLKQEPTPDFKCKDKFLLVTLPCPYNDVETQIADLWPQLEQEFKATSKKIKVNYVISGAPKGASTGSAAAIGGSGAGGATSQRAAIPESAPIPASIAKSKAEEGDATYSTTVDEQSSSLPSDKEQPLKSMTSNTAAVTTDVVAASKGGIPLPLALVVIILAILIGKYFF